MSRHRFSVLPGTWAIARLGPRDPIPPWALGSATFVSITRTADELTVVCRDDAPFGDVPIERGWAILKLHGPIPFTEVGVLARFASPLAAARISLFAISTFDTDYLLVKACDRAAACDALAAAGHQLVS